MDSISEGSYLIVDIESDLTKAIVVERTDGGYSVRGVGEAQTTVQPPYLDVTIGVKNALAMLEQDLGTKISEVEEGMGGRLFLCSSSTSGGLHMMVAGVIGTISTESAQRAALGAGALLMDVFSKDDPRPPYKIVEIMRILRPDIFLLAGGTDGGAFKQVMDMVDLVNAADIRPRFGPEYKLPVIYAGNIEVRDDATQTLKQDRYATKVVENVRPIIDKENLGPAREGIYDAYMEHVIVHSPGYDELVKWTEGMIIPTQAAIGGILYSYAVERGANMIGVDVGGATTDVYSVFNGIFNRSLNADFGMTYGIANIMKQAGIERILRWVPTDMSERTARNIIGNIMIRQPETLTPEEDLVQQATAREAIRLGLEHHKEIATRLKGIRIERGIADIFQQSLEGTHIDMLRTDVIIGKGSVFTKGRSSGEVALMLLDALQPEGLTELLLESSNITPHLGMLLKLNPEAALEILTKEGLRRLGTCIAPSGVGKEGQEAMRIQVAGPEGTLQEIVNFGELRAIRLGSDERAEVEIDPARRLDIGEGGGKRVSKVVTGGDLGLIIDARGRPLKVPESKETLVRWLDMLRPSPVPIHAVT